MNTRSGSHRAQAPSRWAQAAERRLTPASWLRAVLRQWPLLLVLLVIAVGAVVVADDHFRRGTFIMSGGVCLAAFLRAVLPSEVAGLLRLRSRFMDILTMGLLGAGCLIACLIVPPPS